MNFKRPYWLLLYIALGCLVFGFAIVMLVTPDFKSAPDWRLWTFISGAISIWFGAFAFVGSLIWMTIAGIISSIHSHHPKH
jgi:hypothetical protein